MQKSFFQFFLVVFFMGACISFVWPTEAEAATTYTVCASGCDFTRLTDALASPLIVDDIVEIGSGYVYDPLLENTGLGIPDGVTLRCASGAPTYGDGTQTMSLSPNNNATIEGCTFENVQIDVYTRTGVRILSNTFNQNSNNRILFNNDNGFEISNNTNIENIIIGASDNGVISNNEMSCYNNNICLFIGGVGVITDYNDSAQISETITISDNTIVNHTTSSGGDWILINAGKSITFDGNTIKAGVTMDNTFATMLTLQNAEVAVTHNTFIMPEKVAPADQNTSAINLRVGDADLDLTIDHNTIIMGSQASTVGGSSCLGLYDGGGHTPSTTTVDFNYNICYNGTGTASGLGIITNYNPIDSTFNLNDSYNGFYNVQTLIYDVVTNANITPDTTSVTSDPILRTENADNSDDYEVVPMSSYLDVNGTEDIGAKSISRVSTYTIDDDCTVDYATCFSQLSSVLENVVRTGDEITIEDGTYAPIALPSGLSNITLSGSGAGTIIDATGVSQGLTLTDLTDSTIKDFSIRNAATTTTVYRLFSYSMSAGGDDYDDAGNSALYVHGPTCNLTDFLAAPFNDVTGLDGIGTNNLGLYLVRSPGPPDSLVTVYIPESTAADPNEVETNCGYPVAFFEHFVGDVFDVALDGTYTYDEAAVAGAGITPLGDGSDPFLTKIVTLPAGIYFDGSSDNIISNITFSGNTTDVYFDVNSSGNMIEDSIFDAITNDIITVATGDNSITDSTFDISTLSVTAAGDLKIYYTLDATVLAALDSSPLLNATIAIKNKNGTTVQTLTTDASGEATTQVLSTIIGSGDPLVVTTGNLNPFTFRTTLTGYLSQTSSATMLFTPYTLGVNLVVGTDPVASTHKTSGSYCPACVLATNQQLTPTNPMTPVTEPTPTPAHARAQKLAILPNMTIGSTGPGVLELQKFLNENGFTLTLVGPGSPGNETSLFGALTRGALARFQRVKGIFPPAGYFGPITRGVIGKM